MPGKNEPSIKEETDTFLELDEIKEEPTTNDAMGLSSEHNLDVSYEFVEYDLKEDPCDLNQQAIPNTKDKGRPKERTTCKFCKLPLQNLGHMKSHCMRKPYKCSACKQTFDCSGELGQHVKLHKADP